LLLGIDLGTSAIKVALINPDTGLTQVASSSEMTIESPRPGWAEQNPERWWHATLEALSKLPDLGEVTAIGISYQMHGLVLVDADLNPTRPAIIWCDGRAIDCGERLNLDVDAHLNRAGNFTLAKLRWVFENEPAVLNRSVKAMLPGDYLAAKLTGKIRTTSTGLSEMIAWNFAESRASIEAWEATGAHLDQMPDLAPIFGGQGSLRQNVLGLRKGTPVTYRAGDQPNNALSLNVFEPGELAAVAGTSGVLYGIADRPIRDPLERANPFLHVNEKLGILLCINGAGSFYSWVRKSLQIDSFEALNDMAASSPPGAKGVIAIPYGNGPERSLGNRTPGASFHHIDTNRHQTGDLARAAMEGIAFAMRLGSEALPEPPRIVRAGDASMFRSPLFGQVFADALGCRLQILDTDGALGAARAAGVGLGIWDIKTAFESLRVVREYEPLANLDEAFLAWRRCLEASLAVH